MTKEAVKEFEKIDHSMRQRIINFFVKRVLPTQNPRMFGKSLTGHLTGYWSYRIGDFRVLADIRDSSLTIIAIHIDHRRQVYDD